MKEHKSLWLVWQNVNTRLFYHVGTLSFYDNQYIFQYTYQSDGPQKVNDALRNGYLLHPMFPELKKEYKSTNLFGAFKRRLPSEIRVDFQGILNDLHLTENYSDMELLERTRGKLGSDQYSFEKPLKIYDSVLKTSFYINGMSYQELPENWYDILKSHKNVRLQLEPENPVDENAIAIYSEFDVKLGYVPRFYSSGISALLMSGMSPNIKVNYVNEEASPSWWVKLDFECEVPTLTKDGLSNLDPIFEQVI
ncbi:HIRAN domain-containing protein [Lysinibacillus boronitolerans]|uniref:HIRAN domain-containing protein n=1 Tax=Lysinibacillus boronitolerans TaxID=309788 RepID=UPI00289D248A|nr:HIRAN domain-containing protein [Lysinibacillus boronitolerans]